MQNVFPVVRILDFEKAKAFYVDGLGFKIEWTVDEGDTPVFMQVTREGQSLYLTQNPQDGTPPGAVYMYVPDVETWCADTAARGLEPHEPVSLQPWGNREARYRDPFGNWMTVATRPA